MDCPHLIKRVELLSSNKEQLLSALRGIERECLRVSPDGRIAKSPHPRALGSTLTHPYITTDFTESLLEFVTSPHHSIAKVLEQLLQIHLVTSRHLGDEMLWGGSMPALFNADEDIPIANYGSSNIGRMKSLYRMGLGYRYGRSMQTVAGVHFNYSLPDSIWALMQQQDSNFQTLQDYKNQGYFALLRNFKRWHWLLIYLLGSSPAVSRSFIRGKRHKLERFDEETYYLPEATSLRLGSLGYKSETQEQFSISYNDIQSYIKDLLYVLSKPHPDYQKVGLKDPKAATWRQLNVNLLQIENEYYSVVRPKQTTRSKETQLQGLWNRGVEYVEVRCLDLDPFSLIGLDEEQVHFLEIFLLCCLFCDSPPLSEEESNILFRNQEAVVNRGRQPGLKLEFQVEGRRQECYFLEWAQLLLQRMEAIAQLLDEAYQTQGYSHSLQNMRQCIEDPDLTPSARLLSLFRESGSSYIDWMLDRSHDYKQQLLSMKLAPQVEARFDQLAQESLQRQRKLEAQSHLSFEEFLQQYFWQYDPKLFR